MIGLCGASGRIGKPLYWYLKDQGEDVLGTYCNNRGMSLVKYDLRHDSLDFFDECDYVIVAAAYCNTPFCENNKMESFLLNVWRTSKLLSHLSMKQIPTLFISSVAAKENLDTVYGKHKLQIEKYIKDNYLDIDYIRPGKTGKHNVQKLCKEIYEYIESGRR